MRRIINILIFLMFTVGMCAQKKDITKAKDYIKSGKDFDKAEDLMTKLLKDSTNKDNKKIWLTLLDAQKAQYEAGNEKLYLKQKYDTAALFNVAKRMFDTAEGLDSVEMKPNKRGRVEIEYRKKNALYLNIYRRNLYNGGTYFIKKQKYNDAYSFFDTYIECGIQPLFADFKYNENDTLMSTAAYWAVYCGYKMKDKKATLHHTYLALKDKQHYHLMLQYLAETYKLEKDSDRYLQILEEGFRKYPKFPFFFPRLIEYYSQHKQWEKAMGACDLALKADSTDHIFLLMKSSVLLNTEKYTECINICNDLLKADSTMNEAYLNAGLGYFNQAVELSKNTQNSLKYRNRILTFYRKALPYLEKYRALEPNSQTRWGVPLYTIYLNLNMGKEFDEIDHLLKK
jgi:hypothetical protein